MPLIQPAANGCIISRICPRTAGETAFICGRFEFWSRIYIRLFQRPRTTAPEKKVLFVSKAGKHAIRPSADCPLMSRRRIKPTVLKRRICGQAGAASPQLIGR
jgi:hypothetical protein